jgi:hypothetical protein
MNAGNLGYAALDSQHWLQQQETNLFAGKQCAVQQVVGPLSTWILRIKSNYWSIRKTTTPSPAKTFTPSTGL